MNTIRAMLEAIRNYAQEASGEENPEINLKVFLNNGKYVDTQYGSISLHDEFLQVVDANWNTIVVKYEYVAAIQTA